METLISNKPAAEAANQLRTAIEKVGGDSICFLSGGSALEILTELNLTQEQKRRTIFVMGDERWSREAYEVNYLQLLRVLGDGATELKIIDTSPRAKESHEHMIDRLNCEIEKNFSNHKGLIKTIAVLGMGEDGHTASIFPMDDRSFQSTYNRDSTYVSVHYRGLKSEHRASLTPSFILNQVDKVIAYVVGNKKKKILKKLINEDLEINLLPAQLIKLHKDSVLVTDQSVVN